MRLLQRRLDSASLEGVERSLPHMSGTAIAYAAMPCPCMLLRDRRYWGSIWCYAVSGIDLALAATRQDQHRAELEEKEPGVLRIRYAVSGTDIAYVPRRKSRHWKGK
eukprot:2758496-Rhodomonas_salina.1